jgi:hypothetical protein
MFVMTRQHKSSEISLLYWTVTALRFMRLSGLGPTSLTRNPIRKSHVG